MGSQVLHNCFAELMQWSVEQGKDVCHQFVSIDL